MDFYRGLPFNQPSGVAEAIALIQRTDLSCEYPIVVDLTSRSGNFLEVGCGTGWFIAASERHLRVQGVGIDFNPVAIDFAHKVAMKMNLESEYVCADLWTYHPTSPFDLVVSLGVLHHTANCLGAIERVLTSFVSRGGLIRGALPRLWA